MGDYLFKVLYLGRKTLNSFFSQVNATDGCDSFFETGGIYREWTQLKFATDMCEGRCTHPMFYNSVFQRCKIGERAKGIRGLRRGPGDSTSGATFLDATQWHLEPWFP